jgi:hypothetical protein
VPGYSTTFEKKEGKEEKGRKGERAKGKEEEKNERKGPGGVSIYLRTLEIETTKMSSKICLRELITI